MQELIAKKYYYLILQRVIDAYIKGCNISLILKIVLYKLYADL